jgi:predicted metal-dependent phosphoesterase TrpH
MKLFPVWFGLFLLIASACTTVSGGGVEYRSDEKLAPEVLIERAEVKFAEYLAACDGNRSTATEKTAMYLQGLPGVKMVTVRGSDTLFVIMGDGNELLLMLGKNRL